MQHKVVFVFEYKLDIFWPNFCHTNATVSKHFLHLSTLVYTRSMSCLFLLLHVRWLETTFKKKNHLQNASLLHKIAYGMHLSVYMQPRYVRRNSGLDDTRHHLSHNSEQLLSETRSKHDKNIFQMSSWWEIHSNDYVRQLFHETTAIMAMI